MVYPNVIIGMDNMFDGKYYPWTEYFRLYAPLYEHLVLLHGREKIDAVYDFFFKFIKTLHWGQYLSLTKVCPDQSNRVLFFWVMETIYQSDPFSDFRFERHPTDNPAIDEIRIVIVEPSDLTIKKIRRNFGEGYYIDVNKRMYLYNDLYGYLRVASPECCPHFDFRWILRDNAADNEWGDNVTTIMSSDGEITPDD